MNELFITLYLDEDVDVLVRALLRARGFDVVTTVETGNLGRTDEEQLIFAAKGGRAMVTHNRADFERLASVWLGTGRTHSGIIIAVRRTAYEVAKRLLLILNDVPADEMANEVRYA